MNTFLPVFVAIPLISFALSLLFPERRERGLSVLSFASMGLQLLLASGFIVAWWAQGAPDLNIPEWLVYQSGDYRFLIDFYFDEVSATYLFVGTMLTFLISIYSRYYLHREKGYKRFFNTLMLFYSGFCIASMSGNLETLFVGWEILGLSSFLLIAFYRERYLPVKNAVKVFSIYRIGDVGLLLAMWLSHHLWHENITFAQLNDSQWVSSVLTHHGQVALLIATMLLVSAMAKSALFPFSPWLARAMEGPTPSSAIFYGSLSVHMGVFLMLRTFSFWEHVTAFRILLAVIGLVTSALAAPTARVQSSVKAQIAYASIAQIGLIFVELALGLRGLALFHFAGNAFLRTYQLLVSPSLVTYLVREQLYHFKPRAHSIEDSFPRRLEYTAYLLSLKEWNLETFNQRQLWRPLKKLGASIHFSNVHRAFFTLSLLFLGGVAGYLVRNDIPPLARSYLPALFASLSVGMMLRAFVERRSVRTSWLLICFSHLWVVLATALGDQFNLTDATIYLSGIVGSGIVGFLAILRLKKVEQDVDLTRFHGHSFEHPRIGLLFLLSCLGLAGFPISPTFLGEDLIFEHVHEDQVIVAGLLAISMIVSGLAVMRIYARVFLGPHIKTYHATANRSS